MIFSKNTKNKIRKRNIDSLCFYAPVRKERRGAFFNSGKNRISTYFKKLRRILFGRNDEKKYYNTAFVRILSSGLVVIIVVATFFNNTKNVQGATYYWNQTDWSGGASTNTANHDDNKNGWTNYQEAQDIDFSYPGVVKSAEKTILHEEHFTDSAYKDGINTSADWNTTNGQVQMSLGSGDSLKSKIVEIWGTNDFIIAQLYFDGKIYIGISDGRFGVYDIATDTAIDLTDKIGSFWLSNNVLSLGVDSSNRVVYIGGAGGEFASYDIASETAVSLNESSGLESFWGSSDANSIAYDSINGDIYIGGAGGKFARYDSDTNVAIDLSVSSGMASFWGDVDIYKLIYDLNNSAIYIEGNGGFVKYDISSGTATNLKSKIVEIWGTNDYVTSQLYFNGKVYFGINNGRFGSYDIATGITSDLTSKIANFWSSINITTAVADAPNDVVYLGGAAGRLSQYNPGSNTATDISSTSGFSSFWGSESVSSLVYNPTNGAIFIAGTGGKFARYDPATNTATDLTVSSGMASFWGTEEVKNINIDSVSQKIYLGGFDGRFSQYDIISNVATDITAASGLGSFWSSDSINKITFNSIDGTLYLGGGSSGIGPKFASYNPSSGLATDLLSSSGLSLYWGGNDIRGMEFNSTTEEIHMGGSNGRFGDYDPNANVATDLSGFSGPLSFWGYDDVRTLTFDSVNEVIYLGGSGGRFANYTPSSNTASNLLGSVNDSNMYNVSVSLLSGGIDAARQKLYIGGSGAKFAEYDMATDTAINLTVSSGLSGFFGGGYVYSIVVDSVSGFVYLGGYYGKFAKYDHTTGNAINIGDSSGLSAFWDSSDVRSVVFDDVNQIIYVAGGNGKFARYEDSPDVYVDISGRFNDAEIFRISTPILSGAFYSPDDNYYIGGSGGKFARYNPTTEVATDLTLDSGLFSFLGYDDIKSIMADAGHQKIYLSSANGKFVQYDPTTNIAVDLTVSSGLSSFWNSYPINSLVFYPADGIIYLGGYGARFAQYDIASNVTTDISATSGLSAFFEGRSINSLFFYEADEIVYIGGSGGKFSRYDPSTGFTTDLTSVSGLSTFWGEDDIYNIAIDTNSNVVYIGGGINGSNGKFARYDIPSQSASNLTDRIAGVFGANYVASIIFDARNNVIYVGSSRGRFIRYSPLTNVATNITSIIDNFWGLNPTNLIIQDPDQDVIYLGGHSGFARFSFSNIQKSQSIAIDPETSNISRATLIKDDSSNNGEIKYYLSNNGTDFNLVIPGVEYVFPTVGSDLRWMSTISVDAIIQDIGVEYKTFPSMATLKSSPYNTSDAANILSKISWHESLNPGTDVNFQVRTAPNDAGVPGVWTSWMGTDGTANTYFSDENGGGVMPDEVWHGDNDQWIQYQAFLISDGLEKATLEDVTMQYVVNAPPEVQNVAASQGDDGIVLVDFEARDSDTLSGSNTPGELITGLQYCKANCAIPGSEVWDDANVVLQHWETNIWEDVLDTEGQPSLKMPVTSDWEVDYRLVWNAKADYLGIYKNASSFKVRVRVNDSEGANNLGYGESNMFELDTKDPTNVSFRIDNNENKLYLTTPIDNTVYEMIISNEADFSGAEYESFVAVYDYASLTADPATVHVRIRDAYGNYTTVTETTPDRLQNIVFYDISNSSTSDFRELVSWQVATGVGAGFSKYNIWRSTDGTNYSIVNSITDRNINYYLDRNLSVGVTYYYKVVVEDIHGNVNEFSEIVSDIPNGQGGASAIPPIISNINPPSAITSTSATITWDTDTPSNSTVGYSAIEGNYNTEVGIATLATSGVEKHSVTLTGLTQNNTYYFRVKSADVDDNVAIDDNSGVGYSFTTLAADITAPEISVISESGISARAATINWTTNEPATSFVEYSVTNGFSTGTVNGSYNLSTAHAVTLPSVLNPDTTYYYKIHSKDASGNKAISPQRSFHTSSLGDVVAPVITAGPTTPFISHSSATIDWTTDEPATSYVEYGTTLSYGSIFGSENLTSSHSIILPSTLTAQTLYHYRIKSKDASGNETVSTEDTTFTTLVDPQDVTPPTLTSGPTVTGATATSATITWNTNELSTSTVGYSQSSGSFILEQGDEIMTTTHSVTLVDLLPETQYFYQLKSSDASSNLMIQNNGGAGFNFVTSAGTAPVIQGAPVATQNAYNNFTINWTTDLNSDSFVELGTISHTYNSVFGKFEAVTAHSINLQNLLPETAYFYRVRSTAEFEVVSGEYSFTTGVAPLPGVPVITNVFNPPASITTNSATITWDTNESADSTVGYSTSTLSYNTEIGSATLATSGIDQHSVTLTGLTQNTTYYFRVKSSDIDDNVGMDDNLGVGYSFTTLAADTDPPIISGESESGISARAATINWTTNEPATSFVEYSTTNGFSTGTVSGSYSPTTTHAVTLPSVLNPDTTYYYKIHSKDASGNKATSLSQRSFHTSSLGDVTAPVVTAGPTTPFISHNSATVEWDTDEPATSYVEYGTTESYGSIFGNENLVNAHSIILPSTLTAETLYHYRVKSKDASGNETVSPDGTTFTTLVDPQDITAPTLTSGPTVIGTTATSATITWETNELSDSRVGYSQTSGSFTVEQGSGTMTTNHSVTLVDLLPETQYFYQLKSSDASRNLMTQNNGGVGFNFVTSAGQVPVIEAGPNATQNAYNNFTIDWRTDVNSDSFVEFGIASGAYDIVIGRFDAVKNHTVNLQNLLPQTAYFYRVRSAATFEKVSGEYSFTTGAVPVPGVPIISAINVNPISHNTATVSWITNVASDSYVEYGTDTGYGRIYGNSIPTTGHSIVLPADLAADTTYHFLVHSTDASNNKGVSVTDNTFQTNLFPTSSVPIITSVSSTAITYNTATITWTTNIDSDSYVEYGTNTGYGRIYGDDNLVRDHSVTLPADLSPVTGYHFLVHSTDVDHNKGNSTDYSFTTLAGQDMLAPIISNVAYSNITEVAARIVWETNENTNSIVYLGTSTNYSIISGSESASEQDHTVNVTELAPDTTYHFQIAAKDGSGNVTYSSDGVFTTLALAGAPQIVSGPGENQLTDISVHIDWVTDQNSDSRVVYGTSASEMIYSRLIDGYVLSHSVSLTGLAAQTEYFYKVISANAGAISVESPVLSFTTLVDAEHNHLPLSKIENVSASQKSTSAIVTFTTDQKAMCFVEYRVDGQAYSGLKGEELDYNTNHNVHLLDLSAQTKYFIKISCVDNLDTVVKYEPAEEFSFITTDSSGGDGDSDTTPPSISGIKTGKASTGDGVLVSWSTDELSSSFVRYGLTEDFGSVAGDDLVSFDMAKYVTSHEVSINNLPSNTKYYYSIVSADAAGNIAQSAVSTLTTSSQASLSSIKIEAASLNEALVTWSTNSPTTSVVEFGTTTLYGQVRQDNSLVKEHTITITGLLSSTVYHIRVKSKDADGKEYVSSDYTFTPKAPPTISGVGVSEVTEHGVTVSFSTNIATDSVIQYADMKNPKNTGSQGSPELLTSHKVILHDLTPGTTFTMKIKVRDVSGNEAEQIAANFSTNKDETAPKIDQVRVESALAQNEKVQTIISWTTDEDATTKVVYREGKGGEDTDLPTNDGVSQAHIAVITNFKPGVIYFFNVKSTDKYGNEAISETYATLTPRKKENIIQIIVNNFQDIFKWTNV